MTREQILAVGKSTIKIKMFCTVRPDLFFLAVPGTILRAGEVYEAVTNPLGAVSGICKNGEALGVKPGEFERVVAE